MFVLTITPPSGLKYVIDKCGSATRSATQSAMNGIDANVVQVYLKTKLLFILASLNPYLLKRGSSFLLEKRQALETLIFVLGKVGANDLATVRLKLMALLQHGVREPSLADVVCRAWDKFLRAIDRKVLGSILSQVVVALLPLLDSAPAQAALLYRFLIVESGDSKAVRSHFADIYYLPDLPQLEEVNEKLRTHERTNDDGSHAYQISVVKHILVKGLTSENLQVRFRAIEKLRKMLKLQRKIFAKLAQANDGSISLISQLNNTLIACLRNADEETQRMVGECLGELGALDPSRMDHGVDGRSRGAELHVEQNIDGPEAGAAIIGTHLATALLIAEDIRTQDRAAYAIQECLVAYGCRPAKSSSTKRQTTSGDKLLQALDPTVRDLIDPYLTTSYRLDATTPSETSRPIFNIAGISFSLWLAAWTADAVTLLERKVTSDGLPKDTKRLQIFKACAAVCAFSRGAGHAVTTDSTQLNLYLLPRLLMSLLWYGDDHVTGCIATELVTVLRVAALLEKSEIPKDEIQKAAQTTFSIINFLTHWYQHTQVVQQSGTSRRTDSEVRARRNMIESFLASIPQDIIALASYHCRDFARALLNYEDFISKNCPFDKQTTNKDGKFVVHGAPAYLLLQQIYEDLDDIDGMAGLALKREETSLDETLLDHRANGEWTHALSCFETALQSNKQSLKYQEGILQCQMELGHSETAVTNATGMIARHSEWKANLNGYRVHAAWRLADWESLRSFLDVDSLPCFETSMGKMILAAQQQDGNKFVQLVADTRDRSLKNLSAVSSEFGSYERAYEYMLELHMLRDVEHTVQLLDAHQGDLSEAKILEQETEFKTRLQFTQPGVRVREKLLALRRCVLSLTKHRTTKTNLVKCADKLLGESWLESTKLTRNEGLLQASYSSILQAKQYRPAGIPVEEAQLLWAQGQHHQALLKLRADLCKVSPSARKTRSHGEAALLVAKWMTETARFTSEVVVREFKEIISEHSEWEEGYFALAKYYENMMDVDEKKRASAENDLPRHILKNYGECLRYGSKYIFRAMPRLLTLWLDYGAKVEESKSKHQNQKQNNLAALNKIIDGLSNSLPEFQFLTALPQLCSRICHSNSKVNIILQGILVKVLNKYEQQTMWMMLAVSKSTHKTRKEKCDQVFNKARNKTKLLASFNPLADALIELCNLAVNKDISELDMERDCKDLWKLGTAKMRERTIANVMIPITDALTATLPSSHGAEGMATARDHNPFPNSLANISSFEKKISVFGSLQRPKKIMIVGDDGVRYPFLCKPKDDLRKDCRVMELFSMINKFLKKNADCRRRKLNIRTYAVLPLNEECGFLEWVPNVTPFRVILRNLYVAKNLYVRRPELKAILANRGPKKLSPKDLFDQKLLPKHPPVFQEWYLAQFPDPTVWYNSRQAYARTAAVMSMVGHVIGLGDRHCENILFDSTTGETVHVDFNCLFDKGKTFNCPEKVPFRLTHNMVKAMGVCGYEGTFRCSAEATLGLMRSECDSLVSVLNTFLYDPIIDWSNKRSNSLNGAHHDGEKAMKDIENRLKGHEKQRSGLPLSVRGQVHQLISEATSSENLSVMYVGWAPYM